MSARLPDSRPWRAQAGRGRPGEATGSNRLKSLPEASIRADLFLQAPSISLLPILRFRKIAGSKLNHLVWRLVGREGELALLDEVSREAYELVADA